jgi:hypothetical protein
MSETWGEDQERGEAFARVQAVRTEHEEALLSKANVVGVGIGFRSVRGEATGEVALVVMVTRKVPRSQLAPEDFIPDRIENVPVDVQAVGELRALG